MSEADCPPKIETISAVILAGGRSQRMGEKDKGWIALNGTPLIEHMLQRLRQQTTNIYISANRNLEKYQQLGVNIIVDQHPDFPGPLAGIYAALSQIETDWLLTVPCDTPLFPDDLLPRFISALTELPHHRIAVARDENYMQPVFCLIHRSLADNLKSFLDGDGHKTGQWIRQNDPLEVQFTDSTLQFFNINSPDDLQQLSAKLKGDR